jgi:hypothetical protein
MAPWVSIGQRVKETLAQFQISAVGGVAGEPVPARLREPGVGVAPPRGRADLAVAPAGALAIADRVERRQDARGELAGLGQDGVGDLQVHVAAARQLVQLLQRCDLAEDEAHVLERRVVVLHVVLLASRRLGEEAPDRLHASRAPAVRRLDAPSGFGRFPEVRTGFKPRELGSAPNIEAAPDRRHSHPEREKTS